MKTTKTFNIAWSAKQYDRSNMHNTYVVASTAIEARKLFMKKFPKRFFIGCIETTIETNDPKLEVI